MLEQLEKSSGPWDIAVAGGGATGLGIAVDAASRGYRTILVEQDDFCKGTSSRSTKLVHGGFRYLQRGDLSLVHEALRERGLLIRNAPHLVHDLSFVVPNYKWWEGPFYGVGMKVYDLMAGKLGLGPSTWLSREETLSRIPTLESRGLRGGVRYHDGQFDDARLGIAIALTAADHGATLINYFQAEGLMKTAGKTCGIQGKDLVSGRSWEIQARVVINATGVFADGLVQADEPGAPALIAPSQGIHMVLDRKFLPGQTAIMVPHTDDGRVLFAVPWLDRVIVGTTDTPVEHPLAEPRALPMELDFLMGHASRYLAIPPSRGDILSVFAGLRPLVRSGSSRQTASLSRDHHLSVSSSGLVTITGGKWTTYRKMGEDAVDQAVSVAGLTRGNSRTGDLPIHGWTEGGYRAGPLDPYGSDCPRLLDLIAGEPQMASPIHPRFPYLRAQVLWAVREEMALTLEDVLSRRTRCLLLDARAAMEASRDTALLMARELGKDEAWVRNQVRDFRAIARGYLPEGL